MLNYFEMDTFTESQYTLFDYSTVSDSKLVACDLFNKLSTVKTPVNKCFSLFYFSDDSIGSVDPISVIHKSKKELFFTQMMYCMKISLHGTNTDETKIHAMVTEIENFCDKKTHSRNDDFDYSVNSSSTHVVKSRRNYYNQYIGYVIPSWNMLMAIKSVHLRTKAPICDFGAGSGILTHLLFLLGCNIYGVNKDIPSITNHYKIGEFHPMSSLLSKQDESTYKVPNNHILLISNMCTFNCVLKDYIERGGQCVIIIGQSKSNHTKPY